MPRMSSFLAVAAFSGVLCIVAGCGNTSATGSNQTNESIDIQGAGSTFVAPLMLKWADEYQKQHPGVSVEYDVVGSGKGQQEFVAGAVDFGASDSALKDEQIAAVAKGVQLVPVAAGCIVLAYNVEGIPDGLKLARDVYPDIYLGKIVNWDDPRIAKVNPGVALPKMPIVMAVRVDLSGTTFAFTNHLAAISEEWRSRFGAATGVQWPGHTVGGPGNDGVAGLVKRLPGAIGYVEYGTAKRAGLQMARLENKEGQFIRPTGGTGLSTLLNAELPANLRSFFPDPAGKESYPIVTYTWLLLYKQYAPGKVKAIKDFVSWALTDGQHFNESLGFIRVPPKVEAAGLEAVQAIQ